MLPNDSVRLLLWCLCHFCLKLVGIGAQFVWIIQTWRWIYSFSTFQLKCPFDSLVTEGKNGWVSASPDAPSIKAAKSTPKILGLAWRFYSVVDPAGLESQRIHYLEIHFRPIDMFLPVAIVVFAKSRALQFMYMLDRAILEYYRWTKIVCWWLLINPFDTRRITHVRLETCAHYMHTCDNWDFVWKHAFFPHKFHHVTQDQGSIYRTSWKKSRAPVWVLLTEEHRKEASKGEWNNKGYKRAVTVALPKTNMDTQNDGSEQVTGPLKNGNFWYLC